MGVPVQVTCDADCRGPSLLPGWSRGHVLAHWARNADGQSRMLAAAMRGEVAEHPRARVRHPVLAARPPRRSRSDGHPRRAALDSASPASMGVTASACPGTPHMGHGRCYHLAPGLLSCDEEGYVTIRDQTIDVPADQVAAAGDAAATCPGEAITLIAD